MKPAAKQSAWLQALKDAGEISSAKTLEDKPTLFADLKWVWSAYTYLDKRRPIAFHGPLAIPPTEIQAYCNLTNIFSSDAREDLLYYLHVLDDVFLEHLESKRPKTPPSKTNRGKPPPTRF